MTLVAGVDCSTQATKVVVCDAESGQVVRSGRADHPDTTEVESGLPCPSSTSGARDRVGGVAKINPTAMRDAEEQIGATSFGANPPCDRSGAPIAGS
jgi:hypothetical protein